MCMFGDVYSQLMLLVFQQLHCKNDWTHTCISPYEMSAKCMYESVCGYTGQGVRCYITTLGVYVYL